MTSSETVTSENTQRRPAQELLPQQRSALYHAYTRNNNVSKLAREFNVSRTTVYQTIKRAQELQNFDSRPRSGRKRKLNDTSTRHIYRSTRRSPRLSWRALIAHLPEEVSISTVKRALKRNYNERKWKSKKRIPLTRKDAKKRVEFARLWLNTPFNTWMFSDECSV